MQFNQVFMTPFDSIVDNGEKMPTFVFDMCSEFKPVYRNNISKFKLSDKTEGSSHVFSQNDVVTVSGYISPRSVFIYLENMVGYEDPHQRPQLAYDLLLKWVKNKVRVAIVDKFEVFAPCYITVSEPTQTGDGLFVTLTLEKVILTTYQKVQLIQYMSEPKKKDATGNSSKQSDTKDKETSPDADGTGAGKNPSLQAKHLATVDQARKKFDEQVSGKIPKVEGTE